ncbi:hypothetical protein Lal_00042171 [Lupinus albus]|nr:hypothetical protein Lal_00042171 [Lupinus albus]
MDAARKKLREVVGKFIIYERVPMNVTRSPWFHNLIVAAAEVDQGVKCPTPYKILTVCLKAEYNNMREWIKTLRCTWKETGVTIMCDGWTYSINHKHIMNFLVYSSKGTSFTNSVDASDVDNNEKSIKAIGQKLMEKRPHLYWSACSAHCLDLCLEDIGKKKSVQKSLEEAKMVTTFIYNHIWIVNLMKKYTRGREILQAIVNQKRGLKQMFNSEEFKKSKFYKQKNVTALEARKIVLDHEFWSMATYILKVFEPIVKVLRLVDGDTKHTMDFIYEAIDRAKQSIQRHSRYL